MNLRETTILNSDFFLDKPDLAKQILKFEKEGNGYLPNNSKTAIIPSHALQFGNKSVTIGRIDKYYFLGIEKEPRNWSYQAFEDEGMCKSFFNEMPNIDQQTLAFWQLQVNKLSEKF